jgi:hypothetical protein
MFTTARIAAALMALAVGAAPAWAARLEITCDPGEGQAYTSWSEKPSDGEEGYWTDDRVHFSLKIQVDTESGDVNLFSQDDPQGEWRAYLADDDYAELSAAEGDGPDIVQIMILSASPGSNEILTITGAQRARGKLTMMRSSIIGAASVTTMLVSECRMRTWR